MIFSGLTERDREAAINSMISSTLFLCSQFCDAIHPRHDQHNVSKAHAHAFPSMLNTHDELERDFDTGHFHGVRDQPVGFAR